MPDITVRPNGTLVPLRNAAQGLLSLDYHPLKKLDIFGYVGSEYVQRTYYISSTGTLVGYAPPSRNNSGCGVEGVPTAGTGFSPSSSPYLTRNGWTGIGGAPKVVNNMVYTSFRYYIP